MGGVSRHFSRVSGSGVNWTPSNMAGSRASLQTTSETPASHDFSFCLDVGFKGKGKENSYEPGALDVVRELSREAAIFQIGLWRVVLILMENLNSRTGSFLPTSFCENAAVTTKQLVARQAIFHLKHGRVYLWALTL